MLTYDQGEYRREPGGLLIALEGPDGCGKSTLAGFLEGALADLRVFRTHEPGGNALGVELRRILKDPKAQAATPALARRLMFEADRIAQDAVLRDALMRYDVVISDRHCPVSNAAYAAAEGTGLVELRRIEAVSQRRVLADLVVLVDADREACRDRLASGRLAAVDPAERDREMFHRVCDAYDDFINDTLSRGSFGTATGWTLKAIVVENSGRRSPPEVAEEIAHEVRRELEARDRVFPPGSLS